MGNLDAVIECSRDNFSQQIFLTDPILDHFDKNR